MEDKSELSGKECEHQCERCMEKRELELEVSKMLTDVPNRKHCFCKLGRHTHDEDMDESGAYEAFNRSKKVRTAANGRFVPANDADDGFRRKLEQSSGTTTPTSTTTTSAGRSTSTSSSASSSATSALSSRSMEVDSECEGGGSTKTELIPGLGDDEARLCLARVPRCYYGQCSTVSKPFYSLLKSGELYSTRRLHGISEQWVYVLISGQPVWRAFCLVDGIKWRPLPPTPSDQCFAICDKESLTAGTQLLVVGREVSGHCIWGYNLVSDSWFRAPEMITQRYLYASASCGVHAFVAGGVDANQVEMSSAERYDSSTGKWEALPNMIRKRKMCSGFYMDGKFYVIGGVRTDDKGKETGLTCGEEYDPKTWTWREIPNMCPGRSDTNNTSAPPLVAVVDNELFSLDTSSRQLMKYCKKSNSWKDLGDVPVKPDSSSGWGVAFKAVNGQLLLIGGAVYAWKPSEEGPVNWRFVAEPGSFVFNCAVMSA